MKNESQQLTKIKIVNWLDYFKKNIFLCIIFLSKYIISKITHETVLLPIDIFSSLCQLVGCGTTLCTDRELVAAPRFCDPAASGFRCDEVKASEGDVQEKGEPAFDERDTQFQHADV